jgi:NADPH2:quinone reductase
MTVGLASASIFAVMKAIRVHDAGGPDVLRVEDIPDPAPAGGELLIEVEAVGVNFIEIYYREGLYPVQRPFTPGSEAAGVVRRIGPGVTEFAVGDRIVSQNVKGAYAQHALVPADKAVRIPDGVSTKTAAAVWLQGLTAHYLSHSTFPLKAGDRCLVHAAAGGVGLLLCQMAKKRGAFVIGTASTEEKRKLARRAGADEVIDYTTHDFAAEVKRITHNAGVDVVYDSVGKTTFDQSLDCLRPRGMMVLLGQSSGPVPPFDPQILNRKGSLFLTRPTLNSYVATRDELLSRSNEILGWLERGELNVRIGAQFPLDKADEAQRALAGRRTTGKVLLVP